MLHKNNDVIPQSDTVIQKKILVTKIDLQKTVYHIWLISEIEEADKYIEVFDCLMQASENDIVVIHLNTPGGNLDTTLQLIDALEATPATTFAFIEGQCCSGGSMIAMACQNVQMSKYSYMMIHTFSGGSFGKFSDITKSTDFQNKWWPKVFTSIYKNFCSKEEINDILNGKDLWLDSDECIKRFERREKMNKKALKDLGEKYNG